MNCLSETITYIVNQDFFWASMGFTTLIGIFIGSVIYDGDMQQMKKGLIALGSYCLMLVISTSTRIIPQIYTTAPEKTYQLFAGMTTITIVTFFYLLGMFLGVVITKKAHKEL
jgi:surface polysaccharide O-acyltransferase-like enzyme